MLFGKNDYFDENAVVYYITRNDIPERDMLVNAGDLENALREKERIDSNRRPRIQKIEKKTKTKLSKSICTSINFWILQPGCRTPISWNIN